MGVDREQRERVRRDLVRSFRSRPHSDAWLVLAGNGTLLILTAILLADDIAWTRLAPWLGVVLVATLLRAACRFMASRSVAGDALFLLRTRLVAVFNGLAWGVGAALLMPRMPLQDLSVIVAGLAGLIGSALNTLAADKPSFRGLALGICVPLTIGFLAQFTDASHLVLAALTVPFAAAMVFVHRQINRGLIEHLRLVDQLKASERAQAELIGELRAALGAVKQLTGLLPICAHCKKVRDDTGYWNSVEHYISTHTDARFSHGVCPDCFPKLFPGIEMSEEAVGSQ